MKRILSILTAIALFSITSFAQVALVFSENMGNPLATTAITAYSGWQNNGVLTFTGTGDVRATQASTNGYTGASGQGNVFLTTNTTSKTLIISNINTLGFTNLKLAFGLYKSTTASTASELLLEVSPDGINYTPLSIPALPTGSGTAVWKYIKPTGTIPAAANLTIRFTNTATSGPQFRIDDLKLTDGVDPDSIITTPSNYGSPLCAGSAISVPFTVSGIFNSTNTFTAQLSDATGSFGSPTTIGTLSGAAAGTIAATIPSNTAEGSNYLIRVVSNDPIVTGFDNTIPFTIHALALTNLYDTICSNASVAFAGQTISTAGTYTDTLSTSNGCDSIVTLHLEIKAISTSTINDTICNGSSYPFGGSLLTSSGIFNDTLTAANGCDSIVTLNLTVLSPITSTLTTNQCYGTSYSFAGMTLTSTGTYYDTLTAANGCDSIITLNLTINSAITSSVSASVCYGGSYSFGGMNLTTTGFYNDTLTAVNGCDSVVTLNLTVNPAITSSVSASVCYGGSYSFGGMNLTTTGFYNDTLTAANGCDSVVTLNLTVNPAISSSFSASVCYGGSYPFGGMNLTATGTYNDTLTAVNGCDSVVTLSLTVNAAITSSVSASICNGSSYSFGGMNLTATGTYHDTLAAVNGCDSVVTLSLNVTTLLVTHLYDTICQGSSYAYHGMNLTASGTYSDTLTSAQGCDSVVNLHLYVSPLPTPTITVSGTTLQTTTFASYQWLYNNVAISGANAATYTPTQNGSHAVVVTNANGCSDTSAAFMVSWLGIETIEENNNWSVYPNPANTIVNIKADNLLNEKTSLYLIDMMGRKVASFEITSPSLQINLEGIDAGTYTLLIREGNQFSRKRFQVIK